jgi:hypothetical protein
LTPRPAAPAALRPRGWGRTIGSGDAGFALPLVLFLVALLTALLAAGLTRVQIDREIAEASDATTSATTVAWSGLQTYLGTLTLDACERPVRPPDGDSVRINVPGGYAEVVARVVRVPPDTLANWLYLVRSSGYAIQPASGSTPVATHTAAQYAEWQSGLLSLPAAFTAANGLTRTSGGSGQLHGADEDSVWSCPMPGRAGLRVPSGSPPDLDDYDLTGSPTVEVSGTGSGIVTGAQIDWAQTLAPGTLVPDFTTVQADDWTYPLQLVSGNAVLGAPGATTFGTGLLIVAGDLTVLGSFVQWYGVVLVGGEIHFDAADQRFDGLVASGLNAQLGTGPGPGQIGGDYTDIDFNSRYVRRAMRPLTGFAPVANARIDNWWTY